MAFPYRWYGGDVEWTQNVTFTSGTSLTFEGATLTVTGTEAGDATLKLWADEGDDAGDKWSVVALAASATLQFANADTTSVVNVTAGQVAVVGAEAGNAAILLDADEGDDNADSWFIQSTASDNDLDFINHTTAVVSITSGGAISSVSSILSSGTAGGVGYATGAGGTVTQATNKSTGVTLSKMCGAITMNNASLAAGTIVSFTLTNTSIAATDVLVLNHISGGTVGSYTLNAQAGAGSAVINVRNNTAGDLAEAIVIQFAVIKGVNA